MPFCHSRVRGLTLKTASGAPLWRSCAVNRHPPIHLIPMQSAVWEVTGFGITFESSVMAHGREAERFHFDIEYARGGTVLQKLHLCLFIVVAKGSIQSTLTWYQRSVRQTISANPWALWYHFIQWMAWPFLFRNWTLQAQRKMFNR